MSNNPSLPPASVVPPMGGVATSSPLRRRARDADDDDAPDQEGELHVPFPVGHESSSDTEDNDDGQRHYLVQPRVEYDYNPEVVDRPPHHRFSPRLRRSLDALDILLLGPGGAGGALPSPTPSGERESDATLSDDDHHGRGGVGGNTTGSGSSAGPSSISINTVATDAVDRGWAATGKRGWEAGGNKNRKPAAVVLSDSDSDLNTVSAGGDSQAGTTSITIAQAAPAAHHNQPPPPVPKQEAQPPRAPHPPPDPPRRREREYTCKECGKSYTTNQALGGHAAGHKNKQREAEAMAAAMVAAAAAGVEGCASLDAAFLALRRGGGKADKTHECRQCGKVFASGVALGGHMRVHYTGPPIVPARKNKKRCLAPPPPPTPAEGDIVAAAPPVGLSLALSIKEEENIAAASPVAAVGLSLGMSIKAEEEPPSMPPAAPAGGAVRVVRLFGMNISPQVQQSPLQQQQGSGGTSEGSSSIGEEQQRH